MPDGFSWPGDSDDLNRRRFLATSAVSSVAIVGVVTGSARSTASVQATEITDWNDLAAVRENLDGDYVLANDLDEQTTGYDEHVGDPVEGWEPIGDFDPDADVEFTGTFDGNGHEIAGLKSNRPETNFVGLFGTNEGTIENVILTDVDITGDRYVGGLVGWNGGEVSASSVREADITGKERVGDYGNRVGGLVGSNTGEVSASSVSGADITGNERVGGLVGRNGGAVWGSWAAGDVFGDRRVGGFVGWNTSNGEVSWGYWDTESSSIQPAGIGSGDGDVIGLTTDEMQGEAAAANMDALDFEVTWAVRTDPDDYPRLEWQDELDDTGEDDTGEDDTGEDDTGEDDTGEDDSVPGFGVGGALAGVGGIAYLLKRCLGTAERSSQ